MARYGLTAIIVLAAFGVRHAMNERLAGFPFLLFFPALIISAVLFNKGSGLVATALSAALADYFFLKPSGSFGISDAGDFLAWWLFVLIGLTVTIIIEAQHRAYRELDGLHAELETSHRRLAASDLEKSELLREMGHRVMNNFQIAASLLQLQARSIALPTKEDFLSAAERLRVMARVHNRLTRSEGAPSVDAQVFIHELCDDLRQGLIGVRPIRLEVEAHSHPIPLNHAVSLGLIINELVANAVKYAFPESRAGTIAVEFLRAGPDVMLRVTDDGVGMPGTTDPATASLPPGVGQRIIGALVGQLRGRREIASRSGRTTVTVVFPAAPGHELGTYAAGAVTPARQAIGMRQG